MSLNHCVAILCLQGHSTNLGAVRSTGPMLVSTKPSTLTARTVSSVSCNIHSRLSPPCFHFSQACLPYVTVALLCPGSKRYHYIRLSKIYRAYATIRMTMLVLWLSALRPSTITSIPQGLSYILMSDLRLCRVTNEIARAFEIQVSSLVDHV
jgi:hypothetical protein